MSQVGEVGPRTGTMRLLLVMALLLAVALPLQILAFGPPIGSLDPERFAQLHLQPGFWLRAVLTLLYFPAVIVLHLLLLPAVRVLRAAFIAGVALFVLGNGIDLVFRAVQFLVAHAVWAPRMLDLADPVVREAALSRIIVFNEIAPAMGFCFSLLFGVGRVLMGLALLHDRGLWLRLAGLALLLAGALNLGIALVVVPGLSRLAVLGSFYLWLWPIGLLLIGWTAWCSLGERRQSPPIG